MAAGDAASRPGKGAKARRRVPSPPDSRSIIMIASTLWSPSRGPSSEMIETSALASYDCRMNDTPPKIAEIGRDKWVDCYGKVDRIGPIVRFLGGTYHGTCS